MLAPHFPTYDHYFVAEFTKNMPLEELRSLLEECRNEAEVEEAGIV